MLAIPNGSAHIAGTPDRTLNVSNKNPRVEQGESSPSGHLRVRVLQCMKDYILFVFLCGTEA